MGIFAFLISLIYFTPVSFVTPYIAGDNSNIVIEEPNGTLFSGGANHLTVNNHYLGKADWTFAPIKSLLSLALKANFTLKSDDIDIKGVAGVNMGKNLLIDDTQFNIDAAYINTLQKNAKLSGDFNGVINDAILKENTVPSIDGTINWENAGLSAPVPLDGGNYTAILKPESENMDVTLSSKDAPIELNGNIKLQNDWMYTTNVTINSENKGLMVVMRAAGKQQKNGSILIKQKGDLKPLIGLK